MSQPGVVSRSRPSRRATAPQPLRVLSERVDATDLTVDPVPAAVPRVARTAPVTTESAPVAAEGAPMSSSEGSVTCPGHPTDVLVVREAAVPVVAPGPTPRRGRWARLVALVTGRRRTVAGRHRPGVVPLTGWSMFAPADRRVGRRRSARAH